MQPTVIPVLFLALGRPEILDNKVIHSLIHDADDALGERASLVCVYT